MNTDYSSIINLHKVVSDAIDSQEYIGKSGSDFIKTSEKKIRLSEFFTLAQEQISSTLEKGQHPKKLEKTVHHLLQTMQNDGTTLYLRYQKSTQTWSRWILKGVSRLTPNLLKKILPACFSNKMEEAEKGTLKAYEAYKALLNQAKAKLPAFDPSEIPQKGENSNFSKEIEFYQLENSYLKNHPELLENENGNKEKEPQKNDKQSDKQTDKEGQQGETNTSNQKQNDPQKGEQKSKSLDKAQDDSSSNNKADQEKVQKQSSVEIENQGNEKGQKQQQEQLLVPKVVKLAEPVIEFPIQKELIEEPIQEIILDEKMIKHLTEQFDEYKTIIEGFAERPFGNQNFVKYVQKLINIITKFSILGGPEGQIALAKLNLAEQKLSFLNEWVNALNKGENLFELITSSPWSGYFAEMAISENLTVNFGIQKLAGVEDYKLLKDGKKVPLENFSSYRGQVLITLNQPESLHSLESFAKLLSQEKFVKCRPSRLIINITNDAKMTPQLLDMLLNIKQNVGEIEISGIESIDLDAMGLSQDKTMSFIENLNFFNFPDLKEIQVEKKAWTAKHYAQFLECLPSEAHLELCFNSCPDYKFINLPPELLSLKKFDFSNYSFPQIQYLLPQLVHLNYLTLSNDITEKQLEILLKVAPKALSGVNLENCEKLTTDVFPLLYKYSPLTFNLSNVPAGKIPLAHLPKTENPFFISDIYAKSDATIPLVNNLYTGPQHLSAAFQIPILRNQKKIDSFFPEHQTVLDPKSVGYWLYNEDYKNLGIEKNIRTVLADNNAKMSGSDLIAFMQKFPNTDTLSLYHCINVTNKDIQDLLKACPNIKKLDLTGCTKVDSYLFGEEVQNLDELIITGTGISSQVAMVAKLQFNVDKKIIQFHESVLNISDLDLMNDLSDLLKDKDLTRLTHISFEDCHTLTDELLSQFLEKLSMETKVTKDGKEVKNPQHSNLAVLNLSGCDQITGKSFYIEEPNELFNPDEPYDSNGELIPKMHIKLKYLGTLDEVIIENTSINQEVQNFLSLKYPKIKFSQEFKSKDSIHLIKHFQNCIDFHTLSKMDNLTPEQTNTLDRVRKSYLHDLISAKLFFDTIEISEELQSDWNEHVFLENISPEEFYDMTLGFKTDNEGETVSFKTYQDLLYCSSKTFRNELRLGGILKKLSEFTIENQHATPEAGLVIMDLLHDKLDSENLHWKTAADVAELLGPENQVEDENQVDLMNLQFDKPYYKTLLNIIHDQFDFEEADEMLITAKLLQDDEGTKMYEKFLLKELNALSQLKPAEKSEKPAQAKFNTIFNLAKQHNLQNLLKDCKKKEIETLQELVGAGFI